MSETKLNDGRSVVIRSLREKDFGSFYEAVKELADEKTFVVYHKINEQAQKNIFSLMLKSKNDIIIAAEADKKIIALCSIRGKFGDVKEHIGFLVIWVLKKWRNNGLGRALIDEALILAKNRFEVLRLDVSVKNKNAIELYRKFGFKKECLMKREWKMPDGYHDSYIMSYYF